MTEKKMTTTASETQELFAGGLQVCGYTFLRLHFLAIIPYLFSLLLSLFSGHWRGVRAEQGGIWEQKKETVTMVPSTKKSQL